MHLRIILPCFFFFAVCYAQSQATDFRGYNLWLNYRKVENPELRQAYQAYLTGYYLPSESPTQGLAALELEHAFEQMLEVPLLRNDRINNETGLVVMKVSDLPQEIRKTLSLEDLGSEGFLLKNINFQGQDRLLLTANEDIGILYGSFFLIRRVQTHQPIHNLDVLEFPKTDLRLLNHWDNLDRTIERGYSGFSIWNWHTLPDYIDPRYKDYARANASIGINGTVVTSVNANALILTPAYLDKFKALADIFRPYGIKLYLTARFPAPIEVGKLKTADPLDPEVIQWWNDKASAIYERIPDFGGFLVKANSEGQPGPQNYGRSHLEGANMLADALAPYKGLVIWRAFVYSEHDPTDRAKQAFNEFVPFDGKFRKNVVLQVKNGPIDFQPREPFHPIFGAMPETPLMMEFQITKEYLGFATHLAFLPKMYEEVLEADTYRKGKGSTVAKVIDGSLNNKPISGMAGVSNIGTDFNWTGHPFGQADWYGFGRLAWDPTLSSEKIAEEWLRSTFSNAGEFVAPLTEMMITSRESVVNYMNPFGLHHLFDTGHHYGPGPWVDNLSRPEWNPVYYHKADTEGIGFDRTKTGSNALAQYASEVVQLYEDPKTCPEEYLLWFHHVPWTFQMKNGKTLWEAMGLKYQEGVEQVRGMQETWDRMKAHVPEEIHSQVASLLSIQLKEAQWWKDACMLYFQTFSGMDFPEGMEKPKHDLEYYKSLKFPYAPGIRPSWN